MQKVLLTLTCLLLVAVNVIAEPEGGDIVKLPDNSSYVGTLKDGKLHGTGELVYANGDTYSGAFADGFMHGSGVFEDSGGDLYEGVFEQGTATGEFVVTYASGDTYVGGLKDWDFSGTGVYTTTSGTSYGGVFVDGELSGEAVISNADGDHYEGNVEYWRFSGEGKLRKGDGETYEGHFDYGRYDGDGVLTEPSGNYYEGSFQNGKYHGQGMLKVPDLDLKLSGRFENGYYAGPGFEDYVEAGLALPIGEEVLFQQPEKLQQLYKEIPKGRRNQTETYLVTFAPYAQQDVFMSETRTAQTHLADHFAPSPAQIRLVNNVQTYQNVPLATQTNLRHVLADIGQKMNRKDDILLLYISSHGSKDGQLSVTFPGTRLTDLSGDAIREYLDKAKIKWRIIMVSACYSGSMIRTLADPHTLIVTSARADRTSFGCSDTAEITYFGDALFNHAMPEAHSLEDAFFAARKHVAQRELAEGHTPSEPQLFVGAKMRQKLSAYEALTSEKNLKGN